MERLRKRLEVFRQKVRQFVKYNWHNEPEGDTFRSLEILYVLGAVRYNPTKKWQRVCWNAYLVLPVYSLMVFVSNAVDDISRKFNLTKATWHAASILLVFLCFVKDWILNRYFESIQTAQMFINSKPFASGDSMFELANDAACRKKYFQRLQLVVLGLFSLVLINQTICIMPFSEIDELLGTPKILQHFGPKLAKGMHLLFLFTFCPLWMNKFCSGTGTVCSLLYGFNNEYEMYVDGFEQIVDNVYSDVEEEFPSTTKRAPDWKRFQRDHLYWKHLDKRIKDQVKLHVQIAENIQLLKPVVKYLFGIIYYSAMVSFSPIIYVMTKNGFSVASFMLVSGIAVQLFECYMWCRIVDSLKDTNAKLELKIMDLITKIPYSEFHRKKYADIQTTLLIMKTFVRNHEPFTCAGVFPISVKAFTDLLHIGYTVFTFLRDLGKKHVKTLSRMKLKLKH